MNNDVAKALVVDDDATARRLLVRHLERHGFSAATAENGWQAIAALRSENYTIVFMDCEMPLLDGLRATEQIRRGAAGSSGAFIVATTAHDDLAIRRACTAAGMDAFLRKPITTSELSRVLDHHRTRRDDRRTA